MMFNAKTSALSALSLVGALLAGCGGGDAEAPPPPIASTPAGTSTTPDTTPPSVTIANDTSAATAAGPVTFTFVFSEDVGVSFTASDVVVSGGTAGTFTRVSGTQATLVVTPATNTTGRMTVSVAAGSFADIAGNASTASATASKDFNTVVVAAAPPPTIVRANAAGAPAYDSATGKALPGNYTTGGYSAGAGEASWWGGNYPEQIQAGYGFSKTNAAQWGFGLFIQNGGAGWDISNAASYHVTLGTNGECANVCKVTLRMVSTTNNSCVADAKVTLTSADITTGYDVPFTSFTVSGCTTNTMAAFKAAKVAELHFQMLRADMQFTTSGDPNLYPNGLGVGGNIYFSAASGSSGGSGGGTTSGQTTLTAGKFASNFTDSPTPWKTAEGGTAGRYIDTGVATQDWWSGVAPADATPSFYFGYGIDKTAKPWGFGAFVSAPNNGTASMSGYTQMRLSVWGNDELMNTHPTLTVVLKGPAVSGCAAELKGSVAVAAPGVQTYTVALSGLTLQTACAFGSVAAALAGGVNEVHVQVLGNNVQYVTHAADAGNFYPNGLNIGPITFQ